MWNSLYWQGYYRGFVYSRDNPTSNRVTKFLWCFPFLTSLLCKSTCAQCARDAWHLQRFGVHEIGTIVDHEFYRSQHGFNLFVPVVHVQFDERTNSEGVFHNITFHSEFADKNTAIHALGSTVDVLYNPKEPQESKVGQHVIWEIVGSSIGVLVTGGLCFFVVLIAFVDEYFIALFAIIYA